jgi:flagellar biosynthesis chaperone FliJ
MKRFRYQLETVLKMRQWELQSAQSALGEINSRQLRQQQQVEALEAREGAALAQWSALLAPGATLAVTEIARGAGYHAAMARQLETARDEAAQLDAERDAAVATLACCRRAVDGFEEHRDDMRADFMRARASADVKQADDQWNTLSARREDDEHSA